MSTQTLAQPIDPQAAEQVMAHHAKTFNWANQLMPKAYRRDFARLYAFCRFVDDAVDEADDARQAEDTIATVRADFAAGSSRIQAVEEFLELARRRKIPLAIPLELVTGVASDNGTVRIASEAELLRYAYRVASTVGLMVCYIVDVREPQALAYAIDLGIGMQLTNIARDVVEDHGNDKVYLPGTWISPNAIASAIAGTDTGTRERAYCVVERTLALADTYYRSADWGMSYLPPWARWGILTASRCYEAIGRVIRRSDADYWNKRCSTTKLQKCGHTLRAVGGLLCVPRYWAWTTPRPHDAALHAALAGLPGANVDSQYEEQRHA